MTEEDTEPAEEPTSSEHRATDESEDGSDGGYRASVADATEGRTLTDYVHWSLLAILVLLTLVATFRFYFAVSQGIDNFVAREFRPLFQAGFNLLILMVCGAGLSVLVRRIR